jgi:hypothetical protein
LGIKSSGAILAAGGLQLIPRAQRFRCVIYGKPHIACQAIPSNETAQGSPALAMVIG